MKLEDILAKCPECGSQDKTVHRKMIDNYHAHAETESFKCENCGFVFETNDKSSTEEKNKIVRDLNKKIL